MPRAYREPHGAPSRARPELGGRARLAHAGRLNRSGARARALRDRARGRPRRPRRARDREEEDEEVQGQEQEEPDEHQDEEVEEHEVEEEEVEGQAALRLNQLASARSSVASVSGSACTSAARAGRNLQASTAPTTATAAVTSDARDIAYTNDSRAASASGAPTRPSCALTCSAAPTDWSAASRTWLGTLAGSLAFRFEE